MMIHRLALRSGQQGIAPPLQSDHSGHGFAHAFPNPGHLHIEGVEQHQGFPPFGRGEQGRDEALAVEVAHEGGGMG